MPRARRYDSDDERLPEGMTRVGYDADTQTYTFRDADGSLWESAPGNEYGRLTQVGASSYGNHQDDGDDQPFLLSNASRPQPSWRHDMMPLLNFGVIIGVFLLVLFTFMRWTTSSSSGSYAKCPADTTPYTIRKDDTCWAIAQANDIDIKDILALNKNIHCEALVIASQICLPIKSTGPV